MFVKDGLDQLISEDAGSKSSAPSAGRLPGAAAADTDLLLL